MEYEKLRQEQKKICHMDGEFMACNIPEAMFAGDLQEEYSKNATREKGNRNIPLLLQIPSGANAKFSWCLQSHY